MKKLLPAALAALILLPGCAGTEAWETVSDTLGGVVEASASAPGEEPFDIIFSVPSDAVLETFSQTDTRAVYVQADGDYQIESLVLATPDIDEVVRELTGFLPDAVEKVKTERFSMPEYRFVWYSESEEGGYLSRAAVLTDAEYSYALVFSARAETGTQYSACRDEVLSSFGLYTYEGV